LIGWLVGPTLASLVMAFVVVRILEYVFSGVAGSLTSAARFGLFVVTWTAVTAMGGMHGVTSLARRLRQGNAAVRLDALAKGE